MVIIHPKVSRSYGASTTEIEDIHPDNEKLFVRIAQVLDDPLVGIDFMIDDMARSWKDQKCGVIECNSLPFIDCITSTKGRRGTRRRRMGSNLQRERTQWQGRDADGTAERADAGVAERSSLPAHPKTPRGGLPSRSL